MPIPIEPQGNEYLAQNVARLKQRRAQRNSALGGDGNFLDVVDEMANRDKESGTDVGGGLAPAQQPDRGTPVMMASMGDGGGARSPSVAGSVMGRTSGGTPVMQTGLFGSGGFFGGGTRTRSSGGQSPCGPNGCPTGIGSSMPMMRSPAQQAPASTQTTTATPKPATSTLPAVPENFSPEGKTALNELRTAVNAGQRRIDGAGTGLVGAAQLAPLIHTVTAAQTTYFRIFEKEYADSSPEARRIINQGIVTRDLQNAANKLAVAESGFGAFSKKAEHIGAILGQGTFKLGEETRSYFGMTIDQRAGAIADLEFATVGMHLPEANREEFRAAAKKDAAGLITAYDIASSLSRMDAGNPDMPEAERAANKIGDEAPELEGNVQRATLDAAISFYSSMEEDGKPLTGKALRAEIVSHLGGNLSAFLSADYAEDFPSVGQEEISTIAAEDAYLIAEDFADTVLEEQGGGGGGFTERKPVSDVSGGSAF